MSGNRETYWELGYDQGDDQGTITIETFDSLPEAIRALKLCDHQSAFIDEWYTVEEGKAGSARNQVGHCITKSDLIEVFS